MLEMVIQCIKHVVLIAQTWGILSIGANYETQGIYQVCGEGYHAKYQYHTREYQTESRLVPNRENAKRREHWKGTLAYKSIDERKSINSHATCANPAIESSVVT